MRAGWRSRQLAGLDVDSLVQEVDLAGTLGLDRASLAAMVRLRTDALDATLLLEEPRILGEQLRWEEVRSGVIAPHLRRGELKQALNELVAGNIARDDLSEVDSIIAGADLIASTGQQLAAVRPDPDHRVDAYLERVMAGDRRGALAVVLEAAAVTDDVTTVMLDVLAPAQLEIGRAWEEGRASVAQEHFCTSLTQQAMAMLYPRLFQGATRGRRVVSVTVGQDPHEVGLRIVTDLLERHGWTTTYLGSSVPIDDVVDRVSTLGADILAVGASMPSQLGPLRDLVEATRADPRCDGVKVLVGGRLAGLAPSIVPWAGADGSADNAQSVAAVCDLLTKEHDVRV